MIKKHVLVVILLLVTGCLSEEMPAPDPAQGEPKSSEPADQDGNSDDPTASIPLAADASSGLILTNEDEAKNEAWKDVENPPEGAMAAPGIVDFIVEKFKYRWTIVNYSHNNLQQGQALFSPQFSGPNTKDYKWQLQIYPKGIDQKTPLYVGVYLALSGKTSVVPSVKVSIINNNNVSANAYSFKTEYHREFTHGWPMFISQYVLDVSYKTIYVPNDRLTLEVEIEFTSDSIITTSGHCFNEHHRECSQLPFDENLYNDLQIYAGTDRDSLKAHGAVLAAHSTWFKKGYDTKQRPYSMSLPTGITINDLNAIIKFVYMGKIEPAEAQRLITVADELGMDKLKAAAEEAVCLGAAPTKP